MMSGIDHFTVGHGQQHQLGSPLSHGTNVVIIGKVCV
jgi:hypothetical protein